MREEEGAPKPDMCSADRTDGEPKVGSGAVFLLELMEPFLEVTRALGEYGEEVGRRLTIQLSEMFVKMTDLRSKRSRIYSPPGGLAKTLMLFLFPRKAFDEIFAQAITDMREEHAEALASGCLWKARWIVIRDHLGLCLTVFAYLSATVVKKAAGIWKIIP